METSILVTRMTLAPIVQREERGRGFFETLLFHSLQEEFFTQTLPFLFLNADWSVWPGSEVKWNLPGRVGRESTTLPMAHLVAYRIRGLYFIATAAELIITPITNIWVRDFFRKK